MHNHSHNHSNERVKNLFLSIVLNTIITLTEFIGGLISGSLSLLSDAGHNFSDVISLILGYVGEIFSRKKADYKHSFGFKRIKVFTALINAITLIVLGILIIIEGIHKIGHPSPITTGLMLIIGFIGLLGNLFSIVLLRSHKDENINMKAAYLHLFYDTLSSVIVIVSAVFIFFTGFYIFDIIASLIIAVMMLFSGYKIIKSTVHIFMTGVPENIDMKEIVDSIKKISDITNIHDLHIWSIDSEEVFLSAHIKVKNDSKSDDILKEINNMLKTKYHIEHTVLQIEKDEICENEEVLCEK